MRLYNNYNNNKPNPDYCIIRDGSQTTFGLVIYTGMPRIQCGYNTGVRFPFPGLTRSTGRRHLAPVPGHHYSPQGHGGLDQHYEQNYGTYETMSVHSERDQALVEWGASMAAAQGVPVEVVQAITDTCGAGEGSALHSLPTIVHKFW